MKVDSAVSAQDSEDNKVFTLVRSRKELRMKKRILKTNMTRKYDEIVHGSQRTRIGLPKQRQPLQPASSEGQSYQHTRECLDFLQNTDVAMKYKWLTDAAEKHLST